MYPYLFVQCLDISSTLEFSKCFELSLMKVEKSQLVLIGRGIFLLVINDLPLHCLYPIDFMPRSPSVPTAAYGGLIYGKGRSNYAILLFVLIFA